MALRVTKVSGEVVRAADLAPNLRATKIAVEVVRSVTASTHLRATKIAVEIIRSVDTLAPSAGGGPQVVVVCG